METRNTDSYVYLQIFKYIKAHGLKDLINFVNAIDDLKKYSFVKSQIEEEELVKFLKVQSKEEFSKFLEILENGFLTQYDFSSKKFRNFLNYCDNSIDNLDVYIENASLLSDLNVEVVKLGDPKFMDFRYFTTPKTIDERVILTKYYSDKEPSSITKINSNGTHNEYKLNYENSTWVYKITNNYDNGKITSDDRMYMLDFGVDLSSLPERSELIKKEQQNNLVRMIKK